jgi:transcriptional regulator with XRE-family HTH domain
MQSDENLCTALRKRVQSFKNEHPRLSSQQIAKRFQMSSSTLNRIENEDIKNPTFDQVLKVLRGTGQTKDLLKYLEEFYPAVAESYREVYSENLDTEFLELDLESLFVQKDTFLLMLLAYSKNGCSKSMIEREFGKKGLAGLEVLIDKNAVEVNGDLVTGINTKKVNLTQQNIKDLLTLSIDNCYTADEFGEDSNYLNFRSTNIDKEKAMPIIVSILKEAKNKIEDVLSQEQYRGEDYFFTGLVADTLVKKSKGVLQ